MHKNLFGEGGSCGSAERFWPHLPDKQTKKDGLGRQGIGTDNKVCKQAPCLTIKKKFQNNLTNKIGYVIMDI